MKKNLFTNFSKELFLKANNEVRDATLVRRTYAVLKLASDVMKDAEDIEDLFNSKKLVDFAFSEWPHPLLFREAEFVYLARDSFYRFFDNHDFIKRSVLNKNRTLKLHSKLLDIVRKIENLNVSKYSDCVLYVNCNKTRFISVARASRNLKY